MGCSKATVTITQRTKGKPNLMVHLHSNFCIPYQTGTGKVHSTLQRTLEHRAHGPRNTDDICVMSLVGSVCHYKFLFFFATLQWQYKMLTLRRRNWQQNLLKLFHLSTLGTWQRPLWPCEDLEITFWS